MSARNHPIQAAAGAVTVEFALVVKVFLTLACAVLELARVMYMFNTLQVVTQRAASMAANADFSNDDVMADVRRHAIFAASSGIHPSSQASLQTFLTDRKSVV